MDVTSLGNRTNLALLELGGSQIEGCGDHLVARSPHNPAFWWGNFLLLPPDSTAPADIDRWMDRFAAVLPDAKHRAFAVDGTDGTLADLDGFAERGLSVEASTVMTASSVRPPDRPNQDATYRQLESDDDWAQCLRLRIECNDTDEVGYEQFAAPQGGDRAGDGRGRSRWLVRGVPRRPAGRPDGAVQREPRAGALPDRRDAPGVPRARTRRDLGAPHEQVRVR